MCRLLGYVSQEKQSFNQAVGSDFAEFVTLSSVHCDGWGVATIDHDQSVAHVSRAPEAANSSKDFSKTIESSVSDGALLHLRWATAGLPVSENNTHPFAYKDVSFIHNGATYPPAALEPFISKELLSLIQGDTDSERYFFAVLTAIDELGLVEGVRKAVKAISANCDFTSINCMLLTPEHMVAVCEFNEGDSTEWTVDSHYELRYSAADDAIRVASTGWGKDHWNCLPNHSILLIDRSDLTFEVLPL